MRTIQPLAGALAILGCLASARPVLASPRMPLAAGWRIESSARVSAAGDAVSRPGFDVRTWRSATVPATVVAALVAAGEYRDPYFAMNLRSIPGTTYPIGKQFANLPMPDRSPFKRAWWYRVEFRLPPIEAEQALALHFDGINYRANIWMNGTRLATRDEVAGAYRRYVFDVSRLARRGLLNAVAVEVFPPEPHDLGINWVDWNPTPPDKNMGLWGEVALTTSGPVALHHPYVRSVLDPATLASADLYASIEAWNTTSRSIDAAVRLSLEGVDEIERVTLAPGERKVVRFTPAAHRPLHVDRPRIWWPYRMGEQPLYKAAFTASVDGAQSDAEVVRFGIRNVTSELTPEGHRLFRINGRPILIRGAGWASDMLLRPLTPDLLDAHLRYVREMGLNTVRLEGKLESDAFYDRADELGILLMPGWCCCDQWETWDKWDAEDYTVGPLSLRDQLLRLRQHPSVFVWLNGSDKPPIEAVERKYLQIEEELEWSRPVVSNATETAGKASGPTGMKMRGPYDYVPPSYWLTDVKNGGAFGFATEIGPGAAVPPIESLEAMLGRNRLWPIDDVWNFHAGGGEFKTIGLFTQALVARYGSAAGVEDYARKAQALTYESERAMFEGYARNKYKSTGVIQWMLNNAWPSLIWHLYDYYMRPAGGYFGTKKACEPLHVQYSYDDHGVDIVNDTQARAENLRTTARLFDIDGRLQREWTASEVAVDGDSVHRALVVAAPDAVATAANTYFLQLELRDANGAVISHNFYWLSKKADVLADKSEWYYTPTVSHADLTALASLPRATVTASIATLADASERRARVSLSNEGSSVAFQIRLKGIDGTGREILPVFWDDNYVSLTPGERREVDVAWPSPAPALHAIVVDGWNVPRVTLTAGTRRPAPATAGR